MGYAGSGASSTGRLGSTLIEATDSPTDGPVKTGRAGEAIHELPMSLQAALAAVTDMARAALERLWQAGPDEVGIEFGVNLAAQAGAVIAKSEAGCHLKVTVAWHALSDDAAN